jgi:predicted RNase H-like HicB family nuclease
MIESVMKRIITPARKSPSQAFAVIVQPDVSGGFWASCPSLTGCYSQGETLDEALQNIREAIHLCLKDLPKKMKKSPSNDVSIHLVTV